MKRSRGFVHPKLRMRPEPFGWHSCNQPVHSWAFAGAYIGRLHHNGVNSLREVHFRLPKSEEQEPVPCIRDTKPKNPSSVRRIPNLSIGSRSWDRMAIAV